MIKKWKFMPMALQTFPLVAHPVSRVSSQNCRSAWVLRGVWGYLSHVRHLSPPRMSFLCSIRSFSWTVSLPLVPLGTLLFDYHIPQCPSLVDWAESSPPWNTDTICIGDAHGQSLSWKSTKSLHSAARSWAPGEMSYICTLFLSQRRWFSYDFGSWVPGGHSIPADGDARFGW